jgi:hypothetical protein
VNDVELDDLIVAGARVSDRTVGGWDLEGADADLREAIMSLDAVATAELPDRAARRADAAVVVPSPRRGRRSGLIATVAAAAAVLAAVALTGVAGREAPPDVSTDATGAGSSSALPRSGYVVVQYRVEFDDGQVIAGAQEWAFSGDRTMVEHPDGAHYSTDGRVYFDPFSGEQVDWDLLLRGAPPEGYVGHPPGAYGIPVSTLLEEFTASSAFEENGTAELHGVETRRLRATNPEGVTPLPFVGVALGGEVTSLEVWVDDQDALRRVVITTDRDGYADTLSMWYFDLGEFTVQFPDETTTTSTAEG